MLSGAIRSADSVRRELWRVAVKTRLGRACVTDRATRLSTLAIGHIVVALVLTTVAPLWLLLLGPLILGVPHIIGDVRFLLVRPPPGVVRSLGIALVVPLGGLIAVRVATVLGYGWWPVVEVALGSAAILIGAFLARGRWRLLAMCCAVAVSAVAMAHPRLAALSLAHLHNLVAFGLWLWLAFKERRAAVYAVVGGAYLLAAAVIFSGALDPSAFHAAHPGLTIDLMVQTLAPGLSPTLGVRLVLFYAFAQAIHYVVWIRLMPGTLPWSPRPSTPTISRALSELTADLTRPGMLFAVVSIVAILGFSLVDAAGTRAAYLSLVLFHGWLELAVLTNLIANRPAV
jgi:hypothetical protein